MYLLVVFAVAPRSAFQCTEKSLKTRRHDALGSPFYTGIAAHFSPARPRADEKACRKLSTERPIIVRDAAWRHEEAEPRISRCSDVSARRVSLLLQPTGRARAATLFVHGRARSKIILFHTFWGRHAYSMSQLCYRYGVGLSVRLSVCL